MSGFSWQSNDSDDNLNNLSNDKRFSWQKDSKQDLNSKTDDSDTTKNMPAPQEDKLHNQAPPSKHSEHPNQQSAWRILSGRQQGTSHLIDDTPCEDFYCVDANEEHLFIFVADGAGSAKCGGEGAKLACQSAMAFVIETVATSRAQKTSQKSTTQVLSETLAQQLITTIQEAINTHIQHTMQHNEDDQLTLKDFACTFLGVLVVNGQTLLMQVGDGAIVVNFNDSNNNNSDNTGNTHNTDRQTNQENSTDKNNTGLIVPIQPLQGEYANMTHFVTSRNATEHLISKTYEQAPTQVVVMTDGLQRLALNMADFTPHTLFFTPFFQALTNTENNKTGNQELQTALDTFLDSKIVNARTDDDKTLVIAQACAL